MDTKLKSSDSGSIENGLGSIENGLGSSMNGRGSSNSRKLWYGLSWIICMATTVMAGISASIVVALKVIEDRWRYKDSYGFYDAEDNWVPYEDKWTGTPLPEGSISGVEDAMIDWGICFLVMTLMTVVFLILLMVQTGRFDRELQENGSYRIHLNWFDRIWSELQLTAGVITGVLFVLLAGVLFEIWPCENWFGVYEPSILDKEYIGIPNKLFLIFAVTGFVVCAFVTWLCLISLVKKLKAHQFWEKSLIGGILLWIYRGLKGSDRIVVKVVLYLLVVCGCAFFAGGGFFGWYGPSGWFLVFVALCLALILLFVPKQMKKYRAIKEGVDQVRRGNLKHKISIEVGKRGEMGELDKLAHGINRISEAQSIAVQNELKNQRMKTELISNVSHDLKTPLTSMSAYVDLLKKEGLDSPNAPEYLAVIDSKTQRLKVLTENLFEAAKASSGAIPVSISDIDLMALVNQSLAEMEGKLSERNLAVIVKNQCGEECRVMADGQLLWRVIENLLSNVSKYALENSRVYINTRRLKSERPGYPSKIILEVKNISADQLNISAEELMERFKRGDESRNTEGSGLGLAIARDLVHLMNGTFEIIIDGDLFKACVILNEAGTGSGPSDGSPSSDSPSNGGPSSGSPSSANPAAYSGADPAACFGSAAGPETDPTAYSGSAAGPETDPTAGTMGAETTSGGGGSRGTASISNSLKSVAHAAGKDARAAGSAISGAAQKLGDGLSSLRHRSHRSDSSESGESGGEDQNQVEGSGHSEDDQGRVETE